MFYSTQTKEVITKQNGENSFRKDTILNPQSIFTGNYWDEFAFASILTPYGGDVLLLGLALGGGIRPILSESKEICIFAVDICAESVFKCEELYAQSFPLINFHSIVEDALSFLATNNKKFNTIFSDLYTSEGHLKEQFLESNLKNIKKNLVDQGVACWNIFGLGNHLNPFIKNSPLNYALSKIQDEFNFVYVVPHRRNATIIASDSEIQIGVPLKNVLLTKIDQLVLDSSYIKLTNVEHSKLDTCVTAELSFDDIYRNQSYAWSKFVQYVNSNSHETMLPLFMDHITFAKFIAHDENARPFISNLILGDELIALFLPTFLTAYAIEIDLDLSWFIDLISKHYVDLIKNNKKLFYLYYMPCVTSLLASNPNRYENYFEFTNKIVEDFYVSHNR